MNKNKLIIPHVSGIDTLYYFAQSGGFYDEFYINILEQIETRKSEFEALQYAYQDSDIIISINNIEVKYSGKGRDGFLWFSHEFFRIGFKEEGKNPNINDIQIQLNAIGIYTLGITSLLEYVNKEFLKGAILKDGKFPITRMDVNMFIQYNFNYLHKEMIVSKKKTHEANIGARSSGYELETYYVGKKPFKLRIYNKLLELKKASITKRDLMFNYFGVNGLDLNDSIFNVEFELHREFLKNYSIDTVEDALKRSNSLFKLGCELVRLIDTSSITEKQLHSKNRRLANTLPVWEFITNNYDNKEFMQITTPLNRIEKISYNYDLEDAEKSIQKIIKRLLLHKNIPTHLYFLKLLLKTKEEYALQQDFKKANEEYESNRSNTTQEEDLNTYSDEGLLEYEKSLSRAINEEGFEGNEYDDLSHLYINVEDELIKRGLKEPIQF